MTTTTLDAPPEINAISAIDGPLAELAARCRRQPLPCVLLEARFQGPAGVDAATLTALQSACAQRLRRHLRNDDEVHALGGLAFGLLLRRTSAAGAELVGERLLRLCGAPDWLGALGPPPVLMLRRVVPPEVRSAP